MRKNRLVYGLMLLIAGIFVYQVPGTISAALFYMLLILPICSLFYVFITFMVFKVKQDIDSRHVLKGGNTQLTCTIYNDTSFLFPPMELKLIGSSLLFNDPIKKEEFILVPKSKRTFNYSLQCKYRGAFSIGIEAVIIKDPFRLFSIRFKGVEAIKIMVYPKIILLNDTSMLLESHKESSKWNNLMSHDPYSVSEIRPYHHGDSKKNVHWKMSAKMQQWMVKIKKEKLRKKVVMLLDTKSLRVSEEEKLFLEDYCIELMVGHIKVFLDHWIPTRLLYNDLNNYDKMVIGAKDFRIFYKQLAMVQFAPNRNMEILIDNLLEEKRNGKHLGMVHVFTFHISEALIAKLTALKGSDEIVFVHHILANASASKQVQNSSSMNDMQEKGLTINQYMPQL
ncbi:DUF58 domain-containing protein [Vallitalea okinawensis]|uniref:DUF58 domain-containing protein n=1 Tax=Vallitalea okinawensis TaxID=2078660 RepID=UPI000CFB76FE|nr:DUF58 domain-containing protein [Vallitalea okinawensis]